MRVRGGRADGRQPAARRFSRTAWRSRPRRQRWTGATIHVIIPPRPERRGLTLGLRPSATFVPPGDPRALGVVLDRLSLQPSRIVLVPRPALMAASLSAAALGGAIALVGVTAGSAIGGAVLLSAGAAAVIVRGFGPFTPYPDAVVRLAVWIALHRGRYRAGGTVPAAAAAEEDRAVRAGVLGRSAVPQAAGAAPSEHADRRRDVSCASLPGGPGRQPVFHIDRAGRLCVSLSAGLYVFAAAFAGLVRRGAADMTLLRIVAASLDALAGLLLYRIVDSAWHNRLAAAMAVAIYHLVPVDLGVLTTGNLTNAFAQSVAVGALGLMSAAVVSRRRLAIGAALASTLAVAYLSHTGTLAILFVATVATVAAAVPRWRGGTALRSPAVGPSVATAAAALFAVAIYYAHFMDTYRAELARIGHETATAAADAGGRTIGDRLRLVPYSIGIYIGAPVLFFALVGATALAKAARRRIAWSSPLAGWTASCLLFLVIGILTPVDMRYYLAAVPALAIAAGYGAAWAWRDAWPAHRTTVARRRGGVHRRHHLDGISQLVEHARVG